MKRGIVACVLLLGAVLTVSAQRLRENFDFGWTFRLGDVPAAAQVEFNPASAGFSEVQLPHDWCRNQAFDSLASRSNGYLPGGIGWYRKEFTLPAKYRGKQVSLVFDGIYHNATVFINGTQAAHHGYGYTSFEVDLTPYIHSGKNVVAVKVDRLQDSRWYTGAGIYRHVWLQAVHPLHVPTWGTYITTPEVSADAATVKVITTVENASTKQSEVEVCQLLINEKGNQVGKPVATTKGLLLKAGETVDVAQTFSMEHPRLWTLSNPHQYRLKTIVRQGGKEVDSYVSRFGIRTVSFDKDKGFFLNGKGMKLKGMCMHQDAGCLGTAVPDRAFERRLAILKDFGVNAIRCSHNPPAPEFLNYCDSLGLLVIDEAFDQWKSGYYGQFFDACWKDDIRSMIQRDRNHPSIILWSIGNELNEAMLLTDEGVQRAKMINDFVHALEPSRLTMLALQPTFKNDDFAAVTDVAGYNYGEPGLIADKKRFPARIGLISESFPYYSTVRPRETRGYSARNSWNYVMENDFICGSFMWTGIEYWGESAGWPSKGWSCAPFNTSMDEKPYAGYYRAVWNEKPMLTLAVVDYSLDVDAGKDHWQAPPMAHDWTLPYTDQRVLPLHTPSNCDEVELIDQAGKHYGPYSPKEWQNSTIVWHLPYRKGTITAVGYQGGVEVCRDSIMTSGKAVDYILVADQTTLKADGQDLSYINLSLVDAQGIPVRIDDRLVRISVSGAGKFMGLNSGDTRRSQPLSSNTLPTYWGRCQAVVQAGRQKGTINVAVQVDGLPDKQLSIEVN